MLKLSKLADYAVVVLATLARQPDQQLNASRVAELTALPAPTVAKLLKRLAKFELVIAARGSAGGYRLSKTARTITMVELIEAVDGPISLTSCTSVSTHTCSHAGNCPVHNRWDPLNTAVRSAFQNVSLADLMNAEVPHHAS